MYRGYCELLWYTCRMDWSTPAPCLRTGEGVQRVAYPRVCGRFGGGQAPATGWEGYPVTLAFLLSSHTIHMFPVHEKFVSGFRVL